MMLHDWFTITIDKIRDLSSVPCFPKSSHTCVNFVVRIWWFGSGGSDLVVRVWFGFGCSDLLSRCGY